jgi:hypothetical protein
MIFRVGQNFLVDQIENNQMGEACSVHGERRRVYRILCRILRCRDHFKNQATIGG